MTHKSLAEPHIMHVGYGAVFQNPEDALPDAEAYRNELRLAETRT